MARALVTGSSGFAGRHLVSSLLEDGWEVRPFDLANGSRDVRVYEQVRTAVAGFEPDLVFHLAAVAWPRESLTDPRLVLDTTVAGTLNVLEAVRHTGSHARVLLAGTSEEYGYSGRSGQPLDEEAACRPDTPYGAAKLAATALGLSWTSRYGIPVIITRAFNHTGSGRQACNAESAFARRIVAVERGQASVVAHGNLSSARNFTSVHDVVRAYRAVIGCAPGIYNVCSDWTLTMGDVLRALAAQARVPVTLKFDPSLGSAVTEAGFPVPSRDKIRAACGWDPEIGPEDMMGEVLDYWRSR